MLSHLSSRSRLSWWPCGNVSSSIPELTPILLCTSGDTSRILATWKHRRVNWCSSTCVIKHRVFICLMLLLVQLWTVPSSQPSWCVWQPSWGRSQPTVPSPYAGCPPQGAYSPSASATNDNCLVWRKRPSPPLVRSTCSHLPPSVDWPLDWSPLTLHLHAACQRSSEGQGTAPCSSFHLYQSRWRPGLDEAEVCYGVFGGWCSGRTGVE